jgi:hypothetical protein
MLASLAQKATMGGAPPVEKKGSEEAKPVARRQRDEDEDDRPTLGSMKARLDKKVAHFRFNMAEFANLESRCNGYVALRKQMSSPVGAGRKNFLLENRRPRSPEQRLAAITRTAAEEQERVERALSRKREADQKDIILKVAQRDRREIKKGQEAAARKEQRMMANQKQLLLVVAAASRLHDWHDAVVMFRKNATVADGEAKALQTILTGADI